MSVWAAKRKTRQQRPAPLDPKDELTVRVGWRICSIVYAKGCQCKALGRGQVCDTMKTAAQHAMAEVLK